MSCSRTPDDLLAWLDAPPGAGDHASNCLSCARALDDMRRLRALARALGARADHAPAGPRAPRAPAECLTRGRGLQAAQRLASVAAALALFAAVGAEPLLRRRIDRGVVHAPTAPAAGAGAGAVFWTSAAGGALGSRVGR